MEKKEKEEKEEKKIKIVENWDDWEDEITAYKEFRRPNGSVVRFLCRGLSGQDLEEIDKQCTPPTPPEKPVLDAKGRPKVIGGLIQKSPDFNDPNYKKELETLERKRTILILKKGLVKPDGSKIPGNTEEEQYRFLMKKTQGDVIKLKNFIVLDLSNLKLEDIDFFPTG